MSDKLVLGNREGVTCVTCDSERPQIFRIWRFITRFLSPYPKRNVKTRPDYFCKYPENIQLQFWLPDAEAGLDSTLRRGLAGPSSVATFSLGPHQALSRDSETKLQTWMLPRGRASGAGENLIKVNTQIRLGVRAESEIHSRDPVSVLP